MLNDKLKNHLHLHFLVFIAGFTAILGKLITIEAVSLVWYRMLIASILMFLYIKIMKINISVDRKSLIKLSLAGVIIALHWITFFASIDDEILFGIIVIIGVYLILQTEMKYVKGIVLGILSAFFSSLFAVLNGKFLEKHSATKISFYEFISGVLFITLFIYLFGGGFSLDYFSLSFNDFSYLFILASICTAYAFIASVYVMKEISPYTVVLTYNLEPIYGIILALILFPESEKMSSNFYYGAILILLTVLLNGILKNIKTLKTKPL